MRPCSSCGNPIDGKNPSYCRYCYAHYMREKYKNNPDAALKQIARAKATRAIKKGLIFKHNCSCGSSNSQMHHPDYSKPLEVVWFCKSCHDEFHVLERKVLCA